jgi:hypothetical protein
LLAAWLCTACGSGDMVGATALTAVTLGGGGTASDETGDEASSTSSVSGSADGTLDDSTSGEDETGENETDETGEPEVVGQPSSQLVSSGGRATSESYTIVFTFGQPSQLQSTHDSPSYRVRGGLIGANGSPP